MFSKMFKITKEVRQFQAGDSTGFGFDVASSHQDYKTKETVWTNYKAAIFSKHPKQIEFYQNAFVIGAAVELMAEDLVIETFNADNGKVYNSISLINARVTGVIYGEGQPKQQAPSQNEKFSKSPTPIDDDLPF